MKKIIITLSTILVVLAASTATLAVMLAQRPTSQEAKEEVAVEQTEKPAQQPVSSGESVTIEMDNAGSQAPNGYISRQDALNVVLQNLGVTTKDVRDVDVDLEYKFGKVFYEVELELGKYEYEYHIDPTSGAVLKIFKEVIY